MPTCPKCKHTWTDAGTPTTKPFPYKITFENDSEQGNGSACVLFRTLQNDDVVAVTVNNEILRKGIPYKGCPVFLCKNPGHNYMRPLKFVIEMKGGQKYTATSGTGETPDTPVTGYKNQKSYTAYGQRNGGRWAWRIPEQGPDFGKQIKVVFSNGHTVIVKDTSHNYRESDGFVFKPGLGPNGEGESNTGTSHHGVYLHAPYKNPSTKVTFYFNGD